MADKKLNDLAQIPSIGNLKNIYVEDTNGNQYKVSKESLAEVLGGLLPVATPEKNGLMSKQNVAKIPENSFLGGAYDKGYLVELLTIKKEHQSLFYHISFLITNSFYDAQHGGIAILSFIVSSSVKPLLLAKKNGNQFDFHYYDDGSLIHLYLQTNGGNGIGNVYTTILQNYGVKINYVGTQLNNLPQGSKQIT